MPISLALTGSAVESAPLELLETVSSDGERRYDEYWQLRGTAPARLVYTLDTATRERWWQAGATPAESTISLRPSDPLCRVETTGRADRDFGLCADRQPKRLKRSPRFRGPRE